MTHHLVILKKQYIERMLRGHKTTECRLSRTRRAPFGAVRVGDLLWLKQTSGPVLATASVAQVDFFHPLAQAELKKLQRRYRESLQADPGFFEHYQQAQYATFIQLKCVHRIEPVRLHKTNRHAWVVLPAPPVPYGGHSQAQA